MKRWVAIIAALLISATAAAPALADEVQPSDPVCYKLSGEDYTQVVCEDADGNRISVTTYFNDGCITTQDASGESNTCKDEAQEQDGTEEHFPNDIACDAEVLSDADGNEYKFVTCRNTDGTLAWHARYTQDGCVTQIDADGGELFTACPEVQPWLPPITEGSCNGELWTDDNGVDYKLVTCRDADGNVVSRTRYASDGCRTEIDADGNELTSCPEVQPSWPPNLSCDSEIRTDDNGVEYKVLTCRDADGNVVSNPLWTHWRATGLVERSATMYSMAMTAATFGSLATNEVAEATPGASELRDAADTISSLATNAGVERQAGVPTLVATPASARDSGSSSPMSPATAALAFAGVGAAGLATSRVRLRRR